MERQVVLNLYRSLIRESKKWNAYNFRMYTLRKVRDDFKKNKSLNEERQIKDCYEKGLEALSMIKRQVIVGDLYSTGPLVIENQKILDRQVT